MNQKDRVEIDRLAEALTAAWNAADGVTFGEMFTEDADFVNIRGEHFVGRDTIAEGHQRILTVSIATVGTFLQYRRSGKLPMKLSLL